MNIGNRIQENRMKYGLSVEDLADKLSVNEDIVKDWESNKSIPNESQLYELASIYHMSLDKFLGEYKDSLITPYTRTQKSIIMGAKMIIVLFSLLAIFFIIYIIFFIIKI